MQNHWNEGMARAILLEICTEKNLSESSERMISKHIKRIRTGFASKEKGSRAADEEAEKITEILKNSSTEEEILKKLEAL